MTSKEAVDKYVEIGLKIEALKAEREILKNQFESGRNEGTLKDVRFSQVMTGRSISATLLQRYVTKEIIDRCRSGGKRVWRCVVVDKPKPKPKKSASSAY